MKKIIAIMLGVVFIMPIFYLFGCQNNKGEIYNGIKIDYINEDFYNQNKIKNAYYINPDYVDGISDYDERYLQDKDSPEDRTFVIRNEDEFDAIFNKKFCEIEYKKEMLILYIFLVDSVSDYQLRSINNDNGKLKIEIKAKSLKKDGTELSDKYVAIKTKKTDCSHVIVVV